MRVEASAFFVQVESTTYIRLAIVLLEDQDEVGDCEHANKLLILAVPQWRCSNSVVDERKERFFDLSANRAEH